MNYKKLVLTLKNERHIEMFIVEIQNNAPKSIIANFLKLPNGIDLGFYIGKYASDTTEEAIISDILKAIGIDKNSGHYFIREEHLK